MTEADFAKATWPAFVPGLELARLYWVDVVHPILNAAFPALRCSAALLGAGSDVLGFDTPMSVDHDWGPRLQLFLQPTDQAVLGGQIVAHLAAKLPATFLGYPTRFETTVQPESGACHQVVVTSVRAFVLAHLGFDVEHALSTRDWLTFPQQKLRALTAGAVFHDTVGVNALRARFAWYPSDVWLYMLASSWTRISQELHLMCRAGYAGDELGSGLIGARLVHDLMQLCFLQACQYAPYPKWFGHAFAALPGSQVLTPVLTETLQASTWSVRLAGLNAACMSVAAAHNSLALTGHIVPRVAPFHGRPFDIFHADDFVDALRNAIADPELKSLAMTRPIGNIDQISDNTDLREDVSRRSALAALYPSNT